MNKNTRIGFGRRIKRGLLALAMTTGLVGGMTVAMATPASAYEPGYYVLYRAWPHEVCNHQGNFGPFTLNPLDPYSLRCYDLSLPFPSIAGTLDIQGFCDDKYPGSVATLEEHDIYGWRCKRKENPPTS